MTNGQKSSSEINAPLSEVMLMRQLYSYVSEVCTTSELEKKRRALHNFVNEVCDEINGTIEGC